MNTSNIADMFRADPDLAKDVPGFLARMNAKTIERVTKTRVEIVEATVFESLADTMGGEATERNVKDALVLLAAEPLLEAEKVRHFRYSFCYRDVSIFTHICLTSMDRSNSHPGLGFKVKESCTGIRYNKEMKKMRKDVNVHDVRLTRLENVVV